MTLNGIHANQIKKNISKKIDHLEKSEKNQQLNEITMKMLLMYGETVRAVHEISPGDRKC
ncbi:hypothetical protein [Eubacterium callanderi]|uniref:hypothetical protein n=1 Tax=Eubacterium callanderi TaxID=53442 RepID=UPI001C106EB8|nr:hypothetical protein [Eubacterium callanderi]MBU5305182.1 hypothetical protein [Eubacterium callanderi]